MFDFELGIQSTFPTALPAVNRERNWQNKAANCPTETFGNIQFIWI
jgi:hypothetical protein